MEFISGVLIGAMFGMALVIAVEEHARKAGKSWNRSSKS